ncbi:MAG: IS21-like element helper ATPase IstB, partial [Bacteroidia bacterium]|nr:IS21-like element helper ATPase IstB [Bacteroidia bacterium]
MLTHPTLDKLQTLRLCGMLKALEEQRQISDIDTLSFEERLGLLVDRELLDRENRKIKSRLQKAKLKQCATLEDIDYRNSRGVDKTLLLQLASCNWIKEHRNILIAGPTGTGKTYLACALAQKSCIEGYSSMYARLPALLPELTISKGDGSYIKLMKTFSKFEVLILDDFGLTPLTPEQRRDLLEIIEERHDRCSTIITSQLPIKLWHETINDKTLADAILDRLVHN